MNDFTISPIAALLGGTSTKKPFLSTVSVPTIAEVSATHESPFPFNPQHNQTKPSEQPLLAATTQKTQNVVIISSTPKPETLQHPDSLQANQIPVHIIMEPSLPLKNMMVDSPIIPIVVNPSSNTIDSRPLSDVSTEIDIPSVVLRHKQTHPFRLGNNWNEHRAKRHRTGSLHQRGANRRCARGHVRDENGKCSSKTEAAQRSGL